MRDAWAPTLAMTMLSMFLIGTDRCNPTPTPEPTPDVPPNGGRICGPVGETCGCWHRPPGESWQQLPACTCANLPAPCPPEKPVCVDTSGGPECRSVPEPPLLACVPPSDDPKWGVPQMRASTLYPAVQTALKAVGERCGEVGPPGTEDKQNESLRLVAAELKRAGYCADRWADSVAIKASDGLYEEWHVVYFSNGCLIDAYSAFKNAWPYDAPPPVATCPVAPCPLLRWTAATILPGWGPDAIGKYAWQWNAKPHTMGNCDGTPVVVWQESYCAAIGLSPMIDGTPRASCPVRPDGHPERSAVENWLLEGGPVRDGRNGQDCKPNNTDNPMAFLCGEGNCRICNTPKTLCSEWF